MKIEKNINPQFSMAKNLVDDYFEKDTVKLDYTKGSGYLQPIVSPYLTSYVVKRNGRLNKCTSVLSQDTVLQNYVFDTEEDTQELEDFWNKYNKYQFYLATKERYQYGWGCCEILIEDNLPKRLAQFPAKTACIKKENEDLYYAVQRNIQGAEKKLRLMNRLDTYPDEDEKLPICLWLGGGATHEFYDLPAWYPDVDKILAKINLDMLNGEQINNGNTLDGVLLITGPPQRPDDKGVSPEENLRQQLKNAGTGSMVAYFETIDDEVPLNVDYTKISNDNWSYLEAFSESCDKALMSDYSIPKVRLMIDDVTESMNSNKSDTIWEIYTISLNYEQYSNELLIEEFNNLFFDIDCPVEMETPIFTDKEQISLDNINKLFDKGLLTLGQAISALKLIKKDLDLDKVDVNAPCMNERFYNGNLLGIEDNSEPLMDWLKGFDLK
jgi:hypothetical protein|nr:MAG TPA: hypothetical protein [Caudoviricetes sp.]